MSRSRMCQQGLGTVGGRTTKATTLIVFYLSSSLLNLPADAQVIEKAPRRVEPWSYLERAGEASHDQKIYQAVASTALGARRIATVGRANGKFDISIWHVSYAGNIGRLATYEDDSEATAEVKIATLPDRLEMDMGAYNKDHTDKILMPFGHRFVTAARTPNKTLKLTVWDVNSDGNQITRKESSETDEIHSGFAIAVFSRSRVVTAVRDTNDHLKLVSWHVSPDGSVKRLHDASGEDEVADIALATYDSYPPDEQRLASVVRTKSGKTRDGKPKAGKLKITSWRVGFGRAERGEPFSGSWGQFTKLGSADGGDVWQVAAATLSHRRIVTAVRNAQFELEVQTWDFDAQGKVSLHSGAKGGGIKTTPDVTTQGGARVVTSALDGEDRLTLITWDAIDDVVRLDPARSEPIKAGTIVPLGADWLATAVQTKESTLKLIAWREHGVSLLYGQWPLSSTKPVAPSTEETRSPEDETVIRPAAVDENLVDENIRDGASSKPFHPTSPPVSFKPGLAPRDAMVAVGFNYLIVGNAQNIGFFDKKTMKLLKKKHGEPTMLSTDTFFSTFITGKWKDGSFNEHSINRHLALPPDPPSTYRPYNTCDPDDPDNPVPCINDYFDTRIFFHPTSSSTGRFFIAAEARGLPKALSSSGAECNSDKDPEPECQNLNMQANQLNRRYFAFAVSKTEDPRDGFHQWMTTEPHLLDWPLLTVDGRILAISAGVDSTKLNLSPFGMKPSVYLFALEDLLDGGRYPKSHKLFIREAVDAQLVPLAHYGETANRMFFVQTRAWQGDPPQGWWPPDPVSTVNVHSFLHPSDWKNFPSIEQTWVPLRFSLSNPKQGATFRDGKIYLTDATTRKKTNKSIIRVVRVPLTNLTTKPKASLRVSDGYLEDTFGTSSRDDPPGQIVDYDWPSITANKNGHIVIVYRRNNPIKPEARYSVLLAGEQEARPSNLLQGGDCNIAAGKLDFQTAVVDPADDQTVWMAASFADNTGGDCAEGIVVGKVKP
jgi:hypothetical protein